MSNSAILYNAFAQALRIDPGTVSEDLTYNSIAEWDSVAHMALVAEIESVFDIMLDTDDILGLSSVAKAKEILAKHGITF
jgi:acyl carrier protein